MEAASKTITRSWVWLFALLLFFFNQSFPVGGLTITLLLTPVWFYFLDKWAWPHIEIFIAFILLLASYAVIHFMNGVDAGYYFVSAGIIIATAAFVFVFYKVINSRYINLDAILRDIVLLNFLLVVYALIVLKIPSLKSSVWYIMSISENIEPMPRLKMFTSEASHYSFLWALPAIYFYSRILFFKAEKPLLTLVLVTVPLILSFSLGVLSALAITAVPIFLIYRKNIFRNKERVRLLLYLIIAIVLLCVLLLWLYPDNPLYVRIQNVLQGKDTSAKGRTSDSFLLAHQIISVKSLWWGIGPGQLKLEGRDIILHYYNYVNIPPVIRIPNACADTIVCFGYAGFALRMAAEIFLFFKTEVFRCPFRLWLFLFLFIFQFTGSYITNVSEHMLWAAAFSPFLFPDFRKAVNESFKVNEP